MSTKKKRLPPWIGKRGPLSAASPVKTLLRSRGLHTVCESARCPNQSECFGRGTATFMILGDVCTRRCRFCSVSKGEPLPPDTGEPARVAGAAGLLDLKYAVVTSVTRDDLPDGGSEHFARTIQAIDKECRGLPTEVLTPDFGGDFDAVESVLRASPAVFNHNIETVPRLYPEVRPGAAYGRSLDVLARAAQYGLPVKSGLMVGLGESNEEVEEVMGDLKRVGCLMLTIGQYLQPTKECLLVKRFVTPEQFDSYRRLGYKIGFRYVASGPLVRSSYQALEGYRRISA